MREMSAADFRKATKAVIKSMLPAAITYEGVVEFIACRPEDIIVVSDLHISVRNALKAQEGRIRAGMPKPTKVVIPKEA